MEFPILGKNGEHATIACELKGDIKEYRFPAGIFEIGVQMLIEEKVAIVGNQGPNDMSNPTKSPDWKQQTLFLATKGATSYLDNYCFANDMVKTRVGFVLSSYVTVRDFSYQGIDTLRPEDNGGLCGGGIIETKGCARNDCKTDVNNAGSDGKGSHHVTIHNLRLNDYYYGEDKVHVGQAGADNLDCKHTRFREECCFCKPNAVRSSQVGVWVPLTRDSEGSQHITITNVVSMSNQADGINLHGKVQYATVENNYFQDTGDDIYVVWGGNSDPSDITFKDNVAVNPGSLRPGWYGNCVATYGLKSVVFENTECRSPIPVKPVPDPDNPDMFRNSVTMFIFFTSFGGRYADDNSITINGWKFTDLDGQEYTQDAASMNKYESGKMVWSMGKNNKAAPFWLAPPRTQTVNVFVE